MSSYASLVQQAASHRIALHYERKAHKNSKAKAKNIFKALQQQLDDKQSIIESLIERNVELENKFWDLMEKCPVLSKHNDDDEEYDDDDDNYTEDDCENACPYFKRK